jgi:hypothetical protein
MYYREAERPGIGLLESAQICEPRRGDFSRDKELSESHGSRIFGNAHESLWMLDQRQQLHGRVRKQSKVGGLDHVYTP